MKFFAVFAAVVAIAVASPISHVGSDWTLQELSDALQDSSINPAIVPYLEHALNEIMTALISGNDMHSIHLVIPPGVTLYPAPIDPSPVVINPSPVVINPSPVVIGPIAPGTSPLVQIIVNVNKQQQQIPTPVVPQPEVIPTEVSVVDVAENHPQVNPIDVIAVNPVDSWGPEGLIPAPAIEDVGPM